MHGLESMLSCLSCEHTFCFCRLRKVVRNRNMLTRLCTSPTFGHRNLTGVVATTRLPKGANIFAHDTPDNVPTDRKLPQGSIRTPCCTNLSAIPKSKICVFDFMMMRHAWASDHSFLVEHPKGLLAVCPRPSVPDWMLGAASAQAAAEGMVSPVHSGTPPGSITENGKDGKYVDVMPSSHYFHINDVFPWTLPPSEDLANQDYWTKVFKPMWKAYLSVVEDASGEGMQPNVVFGASSHPCVTGGKDGLMPFVHVLRDIQPGEELLGVYGRGWWAQHFLSRLFVAADDSQLKHIRWIESIFTTDEGTRGSPFPLLKPCRSKKTGRVDLADAVTRAPASPSGILAAAVRKSCQDDVVLRSILADVFQCPTSRPGKPVESFAYPEVAPLTLVPIKLLKQPMLDKMMGGASQRGDAAIASDAPAEAASDIGTGGDTGISL